MITTLLLLGALVPAPHAHDCWVRGNPDRLASRPSPLDSASAAFAGSTIKVCYGRPSARGRTMIGGIEPFGQPTRLGANEATSISFPVAVRFGDVAAPAGTYSLYAIPSEGSWQLVLNRTVERWGIPINDAVRAEDAGTVTARVEQTAEHVETLTMRFEPQEGGSVHLVVEWERARVRVPISRQ